MVIYIKSDGTTQVVSPEHIYQGSSVNTITLLTPFPSTVAMQVGFRLPDGSTEGYKPMQYVDTVINGVTVSAYTYQLSAAITSQIGTVGIAFCALFSNGKQTSYLANIEVEKSIVPELPPAPSEDVYALILKYFQENSADIEDMKSEIIVLATKTNSAYNIASHARVTANEAKEIAQEALDQSKVTGTQVQVRGVFQKTLDFISDPQEQINAKTQVNVDGVGQDLISFVSDPQAQINNLNIEINRVDSSAQQGIAQVDVKAEQCITTANEAREIAQEALEQSKVTGTQVQVGGVFQPTLDFTSDPQEQLDGKVNKSGDTVTGRLTLAGGASIYSGKENTYIELGNVGRTCLEFHAQSDPNVLLDYDAMILARDATSQTDYGSAILEYIAREHRFTKGDIYNAYGQAMRGFKTVTQGAILNDVRSGFYADGYDLYSKSVVVGEGNDKFVLTWDFGGTYSRGLWVRAYSDKNLAVEQKALLIDPTQLEISTANGWTIGGTGLESPTVNGIYLFACLLNLLGTRYWVVSNGFNVKAADSFAVPILFLTRAGVLAVSDTTWKIHNLHQNVTLEQVAYKKII